jgi:AraC-like DNA-binding protein
MHDPDALTYRDLDFDGLYHPERNRRKSDEADTDHLNKMHQAIIMLSACEPKSMRQVASELGMSEFTLHRWHKRDDFKKALAKARFAVLQNAIGMVQQYSHAAATRLLQIVQDPDSRDCDAARAADVLLSYAMPKKMQQAEEDGTGETRKPDASWLNKLSPAAKAEVLGLAVREVMGDGGAQVKVTETKTEVTVGPATKEPLRVEGQTSDTPGGL